MKTFQRVQIHLASLGYRRNQSPFNTTQLWIFIKVFLYQFSLCAYLAREPNAPKEFMASILITAGMSLHIIARVDTLLKNGTIFKFIDTVEKTFNGSE